MKEINSCDTLDLEPSTHPFHAASQLLWTIKWSPFGYDNLMIRLLAITLSLGGSFAELHCLGSGIKFELLGSWLFRIALNAVKN